MIDLTKEEETVEDPDYEKVILYRHKPTGYYYNSVSGVFLCIAVCMWLLWKYNASSLKHKFVLYSSQEIIDVELDTQKRYLHLFTQWL